MIGAKVGFGVDDAVLRGLGGAGDGVGVERLTTTFTDGVAWMAVAAALGDGVIFGWSCGVGVPTERTRAVGDGSGSDEPFGKITRPSPGISTACIAPPALLPVASTVGTAVGMTSVCAMERESNATPMSLPTPTDSTSVKAAATRTIGQKNLFRVWAGRVWISAPSEGFLSFIGDACIRAGRGSTVPTRRSFFLAAD